MRMHGMEYFKRLTIHLYIHCNVLYDS